MVFIQALFALLRRSLGSVLKAIFGWATLALFGEVREDERGLLTATIAAAALWPFLLVGTFFPRQAALFLVVVPVPRGTPESVVRAVWILLTIGIPFAVGWAISRKRPSSSRWKDVAMGFPATLGLGVAFAVACVAVPAGKLAALARGRREEHLALVVAPEDYVETVAAFREALARAGIDLASQRPPWTTRVLGRILHVFAGAVLGAYLPERIEYLRSDDVELTFYPNGIRISGSERRTAHIHALLAESATATPALQCRSAEAQKIEKRVKALACPGGRESADDAAIRAVSDQLATADLPYDDWQILYRELLQVLAMRRGALRPMREAASDPSVGGTSETASRARRARARRLRRTARTAGAFGRQTLQKAAADRSADVLGKLVQRMLGLFAQRR